MYNSLGTYCTAYVDISTAYLHGSFNATWSPMYPWIIGLMFHILRASPQLESYYSWLVEFLIYLFALICFEFFLNRLIILHRKESNIIFKESYLKLPEWAVVTIGYSLFIFTSLRFITIMPLSPDMLVSAFVYLICGVILHIQNGFYSWFIFLLLGLILGFSYLTKAAMFPLAFVFLAISILPVPDFKQKLFYLLIGLVTFSLISSPYIISISKSRGYITISDVAKHNYALYVNKLPDNWLEGKAGRMWGKPIHPMKEIIDNVPLYIFGTPFKEATYPFSYDDTYWYEGVKLHFDLKEQIKTILINAEECYRIFRIQDKLIVCCFILYFMSPRGWFRLKDTLKYWSLLIPAMAAFGMYSLIHLEERYVAAFIVLLWLGLLCGVKLLNSQDSKRLLSCITIVILISVTGYLSRETISNISNVISDFINEKNKNMSWLIASSLNQMGLKEGDKIACIADEDAGFYWARLDKLKIVAQLKNMDEASFWKANLEVKSKVINAFAKTGAKAIVAAGIPEYACNYATRTGWQRIRNTGWYVYFFKR